MIWFISDTHFNHDREFIYKPRGFHDINESNNTIIDNWNKNVAKEDEIYVLGDFFLGTDIDFIKNTISNLNGNIHLIIGNHDTPAKIKLYTTLPKIVDIKWADQIEYKGRKFYLSHYPTLTADLNSNPDKCVFNLFGHTHSQELFYEDRPYMYNVAVDAHNNGPVSIEEVIRDIEYEIDKCFSYLV